MRTFKIWSEGYQCTGGDGGAFLHGTQRAWTFRQACVLFFKDDTYYDKKRNTYWACRLFKNEKKARKSFG